MFYGKSCDNNVLGIIFMNKIFLFNREKYDDIVPGYYMNKVHWSTLYLDGEIPENVLFDMVSAAHETVYSSLSKKAQREISE